MNIHRQSVTAAQTPSGINHIVLNVRDMEEAHRFWTGCPGFKHVGPSRRAGKTKPQAANHAVERPVTD